MVQWLEIRLPMQGTQVSSLIQERLHMPRGPCATTREGTIHNEISHVPQLRPNAAK